MFVGIYKEEGIILFRGKETESQGFKHPPRDCLEIRLQN